jgi:GNAT superfamily N-acetyltransferase
MSNELRRWIRLIEARQTPAERFIQQIDDLLVHERGVRASFHAEDATDVALQRLSVEPRGTGLGTWAMQIAIRLADKLGVTLYLEALAEEDDMDQDRLIAFYRRFGFQGGDGGDNMMWRSPSAKRRRR